MDYLVIFGLVMLYRVVCDAESSDKLVKKAIKKLEEMD